MPEDEIIYIEQIVKTIGNLALFLQLIKVLRMLYDVKTAKTVFTKYISKYYSLDTNSDLNVKQGKHFNG